MVVTCGFEVCFVAWFSDLDHDLCGHDFEIAMEIVVLRDFV